MSTAALSVARAWIDAANRQDAERLAELSSPDIRISGPRGTVRGTYILGEWLKRAGLTLENKRAFAQGRAVVVAQHGVWRSGENSGEADVASRFEVDGGRVVAYERFEDLGTALAAAGLKPSDEVLGT